MRTTAPSAAAALLVLLAAAALGQGFGQNQVILKDFDWKVRSSEHFDIHYYPDSEPRAAQAAAALEAAFPRVARDLEIETQAPVWAGPAARKRYEWKRRPFFLYASPNDFQQSNIAAAGDGTGGITEPFKDRFMVYNDGTDRWLEEVAVHEFVHIMQFHLLISGFWRSGAILKTIVYPLWMMEGLPGYETHGIESSLEEMTIRDAATSGGLISLTRLEHFGHLKPHQVTLAYKQGAAAVEFIASQFGRRKVARLLKLFESRFDTAAVLQELLGLDAFKFDAKYREYLEDKYRREAAREGLREPADYGRALTRGDRLPQYNTAPVFSPDGSRMYYLSTRSGFPPAVCRMDLRTGRRRRLWSLNRTAVDNIPMGNFANLSRVLAISGDGARLAFAGSYNHRDAIYLYDTRTGALSRRVPPDFLSVSQPSFSPDGRRLAFSGMRDSFTDIYIYDLADGSLRQLTDDPQDDEMPVFTPDGRRVVYSSEERNPLVPSLRERRLYALDLADGSNTRLENSGGQARDPAISADGRRLLFARDDDRHTEVCELDLRSGRVLRLTRSLGGSFTPAYVPGGDVAFASLRGGEVHIYRARRGDLEADELPDARPRSSPAEKFLLPGMGGVGLSTQTVALSPQRAVRGVFSTDLFLPAFFYSSEGGFFWTSYWQGSDMLGNHQASVLAAIHSLDDYDYGVRYGYLRFRPQFFAGAEGFGRRALYDEGLNLDFDDAVNSQFAAAAYPLDRHHRLEISAAAIREVARYEDPAYDFDHRARVGSLAFVRDAVTGRYLVPLAGNRLRLSVSQAADVLGGNRSYFTTEAEAHQFVPTGGQSALALRLLGAQAVGRDRPDLILGGIGGVRGYARSTIENVGSRLALANAEWRFPVAPDINYYMWYIFPDFYFKSLFGSIFTDAGYAWETDGQLRRSGWNSWRNSAGLGLRLYSFIMQEFPLVLSADYARRTTQNGGIFYVYLGAIF
ncbi:MAG: BamA/TamA family outer membrane protein [Elusimicrobia bacterium]|nr:BamA/TamA family outer membrane protein [Elusimicrobiota bacterium]